MRNVLVQNRQAAGDTLQATALLYLLEALANELYEECAELVRSAKELGVGQAEISEALASYNRSLKRAGGNGANRQNQGRRFY